MREAKSIPANSFPDDKLGRFDSLSNLGQRTAYRCSKSATLPEVPSRIEDEYNRECHSITQRKEERGSLSFDSSVARIPVIFNGIELASRKRISDEAKEYRIR